MNLSLYPSPTLPPLSCSLSPLSQVEKIRQLKAKSLYLQVEKLHQNLTKLDSTIAAVTQVWEKLHVPLCVGGGGGGKATRF